MHSGMISLRFLNETFIPTLRKARVLHPMLLALYILSIAYVGERCLLY